ncbi:CoA-binding protein [Thioclava sp. SK-1]|uniref:CoA-binding protein n=1 Tax=Thioclava sp. SK-1 TaxID=1889770 RepID=UPI000B124EEF|nr:CoA-binding protein [Thioclava sp. SK-1]
MRDDDLRAIFERVKTVAVVGYSANPERPSHQVAEFLHSKGYRVIPINPGLAGQYALGEEIFPGLAAIPADITIDMVDVFRQSDAVPDLVEDVLKIMPKLDVLWLQLGVSHPIAQRRAAEAGNTVVASRCPKIEYPRVI